MVSKDRNIAYFNWSPDGRFISYLSTVDEQKNIWIYNLKTQQNTILFKSNRTIQTFKWSPNGKYLIFLAADEKPSPAPFLSPINVEKNDSNTRLYLIPTTINSAKPVIPQALTPADSSITEYFTPLLDSGFDWSNDNQMIAFAAQKQSGPAHIDQSKITLLNLNTHKFTAIPYMSNHSGDQPIFSPDGKWLAFHSYLSLNKTTAGLNSNFDINSGQICLTSLSNLATHCLAKTVDENPGIIGWNANSTKLWVFEWYKTVGPRIYALSIDANITPQLVSNNEGFIEPLTLSLNANHSTFGFGYETPNHGPEAYISPSAAFKETAITHLQITPELPLGAMEDIHWQSTDGTEIEGILITPVHYDASRRYPLLVVAHGGPAGAFAKRYIGGCDEFDTAIFPTCWNDILAKGFIIFQPNYRGSSGYGRGFRLATYGDLGGKDYQDVMSGLNYLIKKGIADPEHLAIFGWSYGGYLSAWAISQNHRFKAAIAGAAITDFISDAGTTGNLGYLERYLGTAFWDNPQFYLNRSPIAYTKNITTPLLLLHGENDSNISASQSYELYHALQRQHKSVKMLILPKQGHAPTDANIIAASIEAVNDWLNLAL